jgi:site-specific recombinase XerC
MTASHQPPAVLRTRFGESRAALLARQESLVKHAVTCMAAAKLEWSNRKKSLSPASVARHISSWRGFYSYAIQRFGYLNNPCVGQKGPKVKRALPKTLSPDSCAQLLDGKKEQDIDSNILLARDHAMFAWCRWALRHRHLAQTIQQGDNNVPDAS